jgi:hypothetical protein
MEKSARSYLVIWKLQKLPSLGLRLQGVHLARVPQEAIAAVCHCIWHICVVEDQRGRFSTELQCDFLARVLVQASIAVEFIKAIQIAFEDAAQRMGDPQLPTPTDQHLDALFLALPEKLHDMIEVHLIG